MGGGSRAVKGNLPRLDETRLEFRNRLTYPMPKNGWVCFHCGERFTTFGGAQDHFGAHPSDMAACLIKVGEERGLVMELRRLQAEVREIRDNVCAICDQELANKRALADHKWLCHQVQ